MQAPASRPIIFNFDSIAQFTKEMLAWRRQQHSSFSVKKALSGGSGMSPALVTQILNGSRRLTRDRVENLASLLTLNRAETDYLDKWVARNRNAGHVELVNKPISTSVVKRTPKNHLLSHWLNVYVKDACLLKGFKPDAHIIQRLLGGIATQRQIQKSLDFLIREGFLRYTSTGALQEEDAVTTTTDDVPSTKIRSFHKHALEIAKRAIDRYSPSARYANCLVLALDKDRYLELRKMIGEFHERLEIFAESQTKKSTGLYQVIVNLSPIGGDCEISR